MVPPAPTPSARLVRAAAAEREHLRRHRDELLAARDRLRHVEVLRAAAWTGGEALAPEGGEGGAAAAMADAERLF
ncbi:MAG: hypothetical protein QOD81_2245, partial [Solirubrobacteraceae bacterium]|nr:hypothetical protein [Solirubrobacteraceae bacterium]